MDSAGIPWYSTGTVNVTQGSSNVAGVGTNWVNAGLKVGDIFTIDKSRLYQITAINSNTSLSLQEAYQGATGTSQVYFVIRNFAGTMQAQIAAQVSELVNKYESYIDTELKQITGPAGPTSFPYRGTWVTGRTYNGLDVVQYGNQLYMALYGHTSTSANAPGATGTAWTQLTFDAAFSAVKAELAALANAGAKNQINMMSAADGARKTQNGITYTRNDDGTVTVNGTSTSHAYYYIKQSAYTLKKGSYTLSLEGAINGMNGGLRKPDNTVISADATNNFKNTFTLNADTEFNSMWIFSPSGITANNLVVELMLRDAAITDDTYVPYGKTNAEITRSMVINGEAPGYAPLLFSKSAHLLHMKRGDNQYSNGIAVMGIDSAVDADGVSGEWFRWEKNSKTIQGLELKGGAWAEVNRWTADEDTGWSPLADAKCNIQYRRKNGTVFVNLIGVTTEELPANNDITLGQLPEGFWPLTGGAVQFVGTWDRVNFCRIFVDANGRIGMSSANSTIAQGKYILGSCSFPV